MKPWQMDHMIEMLEMDINGTEFLETQYAKALTQEIEKKDTQGMFFYQRQIESERRTRRLLQTHLNRIKNWKKESGQSATLPTAL
jgi:hypothetical protein